MFEIHLNTTPAPKCDVSVLDLKEGGVFYLESDDEYGVRTGDGWITVLSKYVTSYTEAEIQDFSDFKKVTPRPDLKCTIKIGPA